MPTRIIQAIAFVFRQVKDQWYLAIWVYNGVTLRLFVDGTKVEEIPIHGQLCPLLEQNGSCEHFSLD